MFRRCYQLGKLPLRGKPARFGSRIGEKVCSMYTVISSVSDARFTLGSLRKFRPAVKRPDYSAPDYPDLNSGQRKPQSAISIRQ